jgi:hypothetical protein
VCCERCILSGNQGFFTKYSKRLGRAFCEFRS